MQVMKDRFLRLCAMIVASVVLVPATNAVAQAEPVADLSVTATWVGKGVPRGAVGETVTYAITLTNLGPDTARGTLLTAGVPDQFNPVSLTCSSNPTFCDPPGGDLAAGTTVTATVVEVVCCFPQHASRTTSAGAGATTTGAS